MDKCACKQDISTPQLMTKEHVKMEFNLSDSTNNFKQEHLSTFKAEIKEEQMDHASFKPTSTVNKADKSIKCEMKKDPSDDFSQSPHKIMPHGLQFKERKLKTGTTDVYQSSYMKSERLSHVKERVKQEIFDLATFDTYSGTSQYLPIKEETINIKIEPKIDISWNLFRMSRSTEIKMKAESTKPEDHDMYIKEGQLKKEPISSDLPYSSLSVIEHQEHVIKEVPGKQPHTCDECECKCFNHGAFLKLKQTHKDNLDEHRTKHTEEKTYECDECTYSSTYGSNVVRHKKTHTGEKPYKCDECKFSATWQSNFVRHKRTHTVEKPFKCDQCDYAASQQSTIVKHKRTHTGEKPYKCDECKYSTRQKSNLVKHKRTHTGENTYKCDQCKFSATQQSNLVRHQRTHTGEKPYKCDECMYSATEQSTLVRHKRTHTGEKTYKCDQCDYAASQQSTIVSHKRTHTCEKPYKCVKCDYAATQKSDLVKHRRTHTGEKPYKCDECQYSASRRDQLVIHMRKHTGEKPYKCVGGERIASLSHFPELKRQTDRER